MSSTVGLVGLGLLGRGIAACLLGYGYRVLALSRVPDERHVAEASIEKALAEMVVHRVIPSHAAANWRERWLVAEDYQGLAECSFVLESVIEDREAKQTVFDALEEVLDPAVPIATNTSAIPITSLQQDRRRPQRFLGVHWAEPAHATRFMEIIRGEKTDDATVQAAIALAYSLEKEPCLVAKDSPGFIVNRIGYAMYREALTLIDEGVADAATIDTACRNALGLWASICGPFRWIDLTGGPGLYARAMRGVFEALGEDTSLPGPIEALERSGGEGIKNGAGFYKYTADEAQEWEARYREHAWRVRDIQQQYFPLNENLPKGLDQ